MSSPTTTAQQKRLQLLYPWTRAPLLTNAPMATSISPALAAGVTRAHGLAFLGAGYELSGAAARLAAARELFAQHALPTPALAPSPSPTNDAAADTTLPLGIGILCFAVSIDATVALLATHRPLAVWLFGAPHDADYSAWTARIRAAVPGTHIWIQTSSVGTAVALARNARPDVLVLQGADAGGHGAARAAGIVALLPEAADALADAGCGDIPLIAAGGIADARGAAAALALGAAGVTMGTRFLGCAEAAMPDAGYARSVLAARDGGVATTRSQLFDELLFPRGNVWPAAYDGRALRNLSVREAEAGASLADARKRYQADRAYREGAMEESRAVAWAGTAVGLVRSVAPAEEIVREVREGAVRILQGFAGATKL